jgi:hypothetical protein
MTPTAVDYPALVPPTAIVRRANPNPWMALESEPSEQASSLVMAFEAIQRLNNPSSRIRFAEPPTKGFSTADSFAFKHLLKCSVPQVVEETASWDVEIDLPVWKGPPPFRAEGIVRRIRRPKFRPITEDDIGGV